MPSPNVPLLKQLFTFARESVFNLTQLSSWGKRNKLAALLLFTNGALFFMAMFMTEQSIQRQKLLQTTRAEVTSMKAQSASYAACAVERDEFQIAVAMSQNQLQLLQTDYKELKHALDRCRELEPAPKPAPAPAPQHHEPIPVIPNNHPHRRHHQPQAALDNIPE